MELNCGAKLGPYEILARIGEGGLGQVWKARDTRLDRVVAIKTSTEKFSERFEREARAVAALNHPNICTIHDVGADYIVMEYVEGAPVAPVDSARKLLDIAVQMSDGLAAAHAAGIVHRDLKPDNILITREGRLKILDFGLAKAAFEEIAPDDETRTAPRALTDPGTTIGTIAYMSPEQARGQINLTAQSDQFSLGLVLYELASGKKAFQRDSAAEIMTAIIREDAEPLPANLPAPLRWIVERLLHKEPAERYDSTRDLYRELRQLRDRLSESVTASAIPASEAAPASNPKRRMLWWIGLAAGLVLGAALAAALIHPPATDLSAYKFTPISVDEATERAPAWSPDGKSIAYTASIHGIFQVFTKVPGAQDTAQLTHMPLPCTLPFWSPDGANIYYTSHGDLWSVGASGGKPELVLEKAAAPALHPDRKTLVFARDGKTWVAPLKGGTPEELASVPHGIPTQMKFSPDGSRLAVILNGTELWLQPWPAGAPRDLGVAREVSWLPDSRHVVVNGLTRTFTLTVIDTADGSRRVIYSGTDSVLDPSVSPDGKRIAYATGATEWDILGVSVPEGRVQTLIGGGGASTTPEWAPSGTHFLFTRDGTATGSAIEDRSAAEGFSRRVAEYPRDTANISVEGARWAPDGTRFLFLQGLTPGSGRLTIANASGGRWTVLSNEAVSRAYSWSPDGEWIAFLRTEGGKSKLAKMKPIAGATPVVLGNAAVSPLRNASSMLQWSPNGEWIAYSSADGISMISPDGNTVRKLTARNLLVFAFSKDGGQVYGIVRNTTGEGAQWQLYSVDVKTGAEKMVAPLDLPASTESIAGFSLHPDGKSFLTSIAKWPFDIWMLEGWDQAEQKTWMDRLLRR